MLVRDNEAVFRILKGILVPYEETLDCGEVSDTNYNLYTKHIMKNNKPLYFGGVKINKNFVSYHLMPLYVYPELKENVSKELKKCLKGKSCFNIASLNEDILSELISLTESCYNKYLSADYVIARDQ